MRTGMGFILTFSITESLSFEELDQFREQILRVKEADFVPMVMCGNKVREDDWGCFLNSLF